MDCFVHLELELKILEAVKRIIQNILTKFSITELKTNLPENKDDLKNSFYLKIQKIF